MPETLNPEETEGIELSLSPSSKVPQDEPGIDKTNINSMAAKFRELIGKKGATAAPEPKKEETAKGEKVADTAKTTEQTKASETPKKEDKPNPDQLPGTKNPRHAEFHALEQARDSFKTQAEQTKAELEATKQRLTQIETEYTGLKKALPTDPSETVKLLQEREALAKEKAQLIERLETVNLEQSPRFQNWLKTETAKNLRVAEEALRGLEGTKREQALALIKSNPADPDLDAILETLPNSMKRLVDGAIAGLASVKIQREEALQKGSEHWKQLQEVEKQERAAAEQTRRVRLQKLSESALARARNMPAFQQKNGDAAHNAKVAEREAFVQAVLRGEIDEETAVSIPGAAVGYLHLKDEVVPALEARIAEQEKLIKQLQQSSPSLADGHASSRAADSDIKPGESFAQKVLRSWKPK